MITQAFFEIFRYLILSILSAVPAGPALSSNISGVWLEVVEYATRWNLIFPVTELLLVLVFIISFEIGMIGVSGMFWILKFIRGN